MRNRPIWDSYFALVFLRFSLLGVLGVLVRPGFFSYPARLVSRGVRLRRGVPGRVMVAWCAVSRVAGRGER